MLQSTLPHNSNRHAPPSHELSSDSCHLINISTIISGFLQELLSTVAHAEVWHASTSISVHRNKPHTRPSHNVCEQSIIIDNKAIVARHGVLQGLLLFPMVPKFARHLQLQHFSRPGPMEAVLSMSLLADDDVKSRTSCKVPAGQQKQAQHYAPCYTSKPLEKQDCSPLL